MGVKAIGSLLLFIAGWGLVGWALGKVLERMFEDTDFGQVITWGIPLEIDPPIRINLLVLTFPIGFSFNLTLLTLVGILFGVGIFMTRRL